MHCEQCGKAIERPRFCSQDCVDANEAGRHLRGKKFWTAVAIIALSLSPLAIAFSSPAHADSATRGQCFRSCVSCEQHCRHESSCVQTCLQLKRSCCTAGGDGPGPYETCSCT